MGLLNTATKHCSDGKLVHQSDAANADFSEPTTPPKHSWGLRTKNRSRPAETYLHNTSSVDICREQFNKSFPNALSTHHLLVLSLHSRMTHALCMNCPWPTASLFISEHHTEPIRIQTNSPCYPTRRFIFSLPVPIVAPCSPSESDTPHPNTVPYSLHRLSDSYRGIFFRSNPLPCPLRLKSRLRRVR